MLEPEIYQLCKAANFAMLTTILPSGRAQSHVMWVDCDEESVLINTEVHRQKFLNVENEPRVTVTIWERENPYKFAEVRGEVTETIRGPRAREHIDLLAQKYAGRDFNEQNITSERVILKIRPATQNLRG